LRAKLSYAPIGFDLLPKDFTISELRQLFELIAGRAINNSNFRKRVLALRILTPTGDVRSGQHRPAPLFRFDKKRYEQALSNGFIFEL
jgi:8-oxo-dGTP diphosphatase